SDNRQTAERLADFIREKDERGTRKIYLIAHSMGGIVCRLMLLADESIASRVEILFQVATPIQGSASAFDTLLRHPRFHWFLDIFWTLSHRLNVDQRARLATTLSGFPSL